MNVTPSDEKRGIVITIEGGDGVGKSTQVELVKNQLLSEGHLVEVFDFPNKAGSPVGDLIGDFLRSDFGEVTPEFLSLAFSVDRLHAKPAIEEALSLGRVVLCDRYILSNIAFQSAKLDNAARRVRMRRLIEWVEFELFGLPKPDVEIVLTAEDAYFSEGSHLKRDVDVKREYALGQADIHEESVDLQVSVNQLYKHLAEDGAIEIIRNGFRRPSDDLFTEIWARVVGRLRDDNG